jgi:purine-binding chemotaxis protein CheW
LQVVVNEEQIEAGAVVDSVHAVLEVDETQILPPPSVGVKFKSEFITGIIKHDERFIMVVDIDKLFALENFVSKLEEFSSEHKVI